MVLLEIRDLAIGYNRPIIEDINLEVKSPSMIQVVGPNGVGKTTLLKTLVGILKPLKGRVIVNNEDITGDPIKAGKVIGYVPQIATYVLGNVFPITVWEFVEFEAISYVKKLSLPRKNIAELIERVLTLVGIPRELWHKGINKLSGGQRQRLLIARVLLKDSPIVVMDEPLSAIDIEGRTTIAHLIGKIKEKDRILIVTCHDPSIFMNYTDFIMLISNGVYVFGKPDEVLVPSVIKKIYHNCYIEFDRHIHLYDCHA